MKIHSYAVSSASYRVRIALRLKQLSPTYVGCHLRKGEQHGPEFLSLNPFGLVPALEMDDGTVITQSMAIIEYLDETHPLPALLPKNPLDRARVRALSQSIACDIHPLNNLRVLLYLVRELKVGEDAKNAWYRHWIAQGFAALEHQLSSDKDTGTFCHGESVTLADICLVPQIYNARRFDVDLAPYPTLRRINEACLALDAFAAAAPESQPDAPPPSA